MASSDATTTTTAPVGAAAAAAAPSKTKRTVRAALLPLACASLAAVGRLRPTGFATPERNRARHDADVSGPALTSNASERDCAGDAVVSLRGEGGGGGRPCEGVLLRDDLILTRRGCVDPPANRTFDYTFAARRGGESREEAFPHAALNANGDVDPRLGFLAADPPWHYQFVDRPVRRNRAFLSLNDTSVNGTRVATSCVRGRPVIRNFPADGELIPLGHLHRILPDLLWEHADIPSAPGYVSDDGRWWSRRITMEEEERMMRAYFEKYRGPPGSVDIVSWHDDYRERAAAVLEPLDPRGHRKYCYKNYYYRYIGEPPFSGEAFFDWVDFGGGRDVLERVDFGRGRDASERGEPSEGPPAMRRDKACSKKGEDRTALHYMNETERREYEVAFEMAQDGDGVIARYKRDGEPVPLCTVAKTPHLYMWDLDERLYVVDDQRYKERHGGSFKHTSILNSMPALCAGEFYVGSNGTVFGLNFYSGHYRPSIGHAARMHRSFRGLGVDLTAFYWIGVEGWSTGDCAAHDWTGLGESPSDAASLNRSCRELTGSRAWIGIGKAHRLFQKHLKRIAEGGGSTDRHPRLKDPALIPSGDEG